MGQVEDLDPAGGLNKRFGLCLVVIMAMGFGEEALEKVAAKKRKGVLDREPLPQVTGWEERKRSPQRQQWKSERDRKSTWSLCWHGDPGKNNQTKEKASLRPESPWMAAVGGPPDPQRRKMKGEERRQHGHLSGGAWESREKLCELGLGSGKRSELG